MKFSYYDLGHRDRGEIVEVAMSGNAANVRLMDKSNYNSYKAGRRHTYYGGLAKRSPVHLQIPHSGHWYLTIDLFGLRGTVRHSIRFLPNALPTMSEVPLSSIASLIQENNAVSDFN